MYQKTLIVGSVKHYLLHALTSSVTDTTTDNYHHPLCPESSGTWDSAPRDLLRFPGDLTGLRVCSDRRTGASQQQQQLPPPPLPPKNHLFKLTVQHPPHCSSYHLHVSCQQPAFVSSQLSELMVRPSCTGYLPSSRSISSIIVV